MARVKFLILFAALAVLVFCGFTLLGASDYQYQDTQPAIEISSIPEGPDIKPYSVVPPSAPLPQNSQVFFYTQPNIMNSPITTSIYPYADLSILPAQNIGPALPPVNILEKLEEEGNLLRAGKITYPEFSVTQIPQEENK